jgi:Ala-tRNA(Pro) deacylase
MNKGENQMPVAAQLKNYLDKRHVKYDVITHPKTETLRDIAKVAHVPEDKVMKSVVLRCEDGYLLSVVPSTHRIDLEKLSSFIDKPLDLAMEVEVGELFTDCELGAIPVAGNAYDLPVYYDDALYDTEDVYFEAGDHENLIHLSGKAFKHLMSTAEHGRFSYRM